MTWDLSAIRSKVRQVTGRYSSDDLATSDLDDYINNFYVYTFPAEVKLDRQYVFYTFNTAANTQVYDFPFTTYTNIDPPFYLNGNKIDYYTNPEWFYSRNPEQYQLNSFASGDGATALFTATLAASTTPILPGSMLVTDDTEVFSDDSAGALTGDQGGSGTINYTTGALSVTFAAAPSDGQAVTARWIAYQAAAPTGVLFFNNQLTFSPIPDTVYPCRVRAWLVTTALTVSTDTPRLQEWGPAISYGASRDIHSDFGEIERYAEVTALYKEQIDYILTRTAQNLSSQRASPSF